MKKIIHHLRGQREEVKKYILYILMIICALILLSFWVFSLGRNITNSDTQAKIKKDLEPLKALRSNIIDGYQNIGEFNEIEN